MIPSTDEFEMYPIDPTSIAAYLGANNYNARVVNLAYRRLRRPGFDVARHLAGLDAPVFGMDLHWLPRTIADFQNRELTSTSLAGGPTGRVG